MDAMSYMEMIEVNMHTKKKGNTSLCRLLSICYIHPGEDLVKIFSALFFSFFVRHPFMHHPANDCHL
uniref:Ovule protein n=1 Tax=Ascaris lumbricoides TaxID=6252 RepID=A0A0M3IUD1_ASCLU